MRNQEDVATRPLHALRLISVSGKYAGLHARRHRRTARLMDRQTDGWLDRRTDGQTDGQTQDAHADKLKMKSNARDLLVAAAETETAARADADAATDADATLQFKLKNELHMYGCWLVWFRLSVESRITAWTDKRGKSA